MAEVAPPLVVTCIKVKSEQNSPETNRLGQDPLYTCTLHRISTVWCSQAAKAGLGVFCLREALTSIRNWLSLADRDTFVRPVFKLLVEKMPEKLVLLPQRMAFGRLRSKQRCCATKHRVICLLHGIGFLFEDRDLAEQDVSVCCFSSSATRVSS